MSQTNNGGRSVLMPLLAVTHLSLKPSTLGRNRSHSRGMACSVPFVSAFQLMGL